MGGLPTILGWDNDDDVSKVGCRLDWYDEEEEEYKRMYLRYTQAFTTLRDKKVRGSLVRWMDMMGAFNFLRGLTLKSNFPWQTVWGTARVKTVAYDPFLQEYSVVDRTKKRMEEAGYKNYGTPCDQIPKDIQEQKGKGHGPRKNCDTCYTAVSLAKCFGKCTTASYGTGECMMCFSLGRKCTFTDIEWLKANKTKALREL